MSKEKREFNVFFKYHGNGLPISGAEIEVVLDGKNCYDIQFYRYLDDVDELGVACKEELFNIARSYGAKLNNMNALLNSVVDEVNRLKAGLEKLERTVVDEPLKLADCKTWYEVEELSTGRKGLVSYIGENHIDVVFGASIKYVPESEFKNYKLVRSANGQA